MGLSKGMYFATDALFASMLILGGFLLIYQLTLTETPTEHIDYLSKDLLIALDTITIDAINHTFVKEEIANGNITNTKRTALEQMAEYWARGDHDKAENLTTIILQGVIPRSYGARISMKDDIIYEQLRSINAGIIASRRMISGIDEGKPIEGSSSYGYLRHIKDKRFSSYAYYGGFVGQGNITVQIEPLPADVNESRIRSVTLEADVERSFSVSINKAHCDNLSSEEGNFTAERWDLTHCKQLLRAGTNNLTILFDDLNNAYIGGGYVRIDYDTDQFQTAKNYSLTQYDFPNIEGIINLYDAIHVPGNMKNIEIYLNYIAPHSNTTNNTLYLTIGNVTVYTDTNSTEERSVTLTDTYLSSLLNYTKMSNTTVPIRLGFENLTYNTFYTGNADVAIVTDVSGSMQRNFTSTSGSGVPRNCDNANINALSTQRLSVAKCLDKDFATGILNVQGNLVGLVSYEAVTDSTLGLGTNITDIYEEIGMGVGTPTGYVASGNTCICCGINSAYDMLAQGLRTTMYVTDGENWNYNNTYLAGNIPNDAANRTWYHPDYTPASDWPSGPAVLGHDAGIGGTTIDTELGSLLAESILLPNSSALMELWEMEADRATPQVDFTSGLNTSGNTFGRTAANDGWDWRNGSFDFAGGLMNFDTWNGRLRLSTPDYGNNDVSGSFGVTVNITQEQYDILSGPGGRAMIRFDYYWEPVNNEFEWWQDQVWIKGRWYTPSDTHWLGEQRDDWHWQSDGTPEIAVREGPNNDIAGTYEYDATSTITGPGTHYLELGGKLERNSANEHGHFYFDNIIMTADNGITLKSVLYPDIAELEADRDTVQVDFSSGLNTSGNTFGRTAANDGWDWADGTFDFAGGMQWYNAWNGRLTMKTPDSGTGDSSGSFGVTVNITSQQYDIINSNGTAMLTFNYYWDDYANYFEIEDQIWIKGRWHTPATTYWLGSDLDSNHTGGDDTPEIAAQDLPNIDIENGFYSVDLAPYITSPGTYYLELGGKLKRSASNEWGYIQFDNILIEVRNATDHYYLRKEFTVADLDDVQRAIINVLSDDYTKVYLNGNKILDTPIVQEGNYWDVTGQDVPASYFTTGTNVLAVELINNKDSARFDLELRAFNDSKQKAMLVMTDGHANIECARQGWTPDLDGNGNNDEAPDDAIQAACDAAADYGIIVYSVGYSEEANEATLRGIAECGNGLYRKSQNTSELQVFYQDVVLNILEISRQSQSIIITSGTPTNSELYAGSYVRINHNMSISPPKPNEIELVFQTEPFGGCEANITIPAGLRVTEARATSYSGDHWTSLVMLNNKSVFNLSRFAGNYSQLGDPFIVQIPAANLTPGKHVITMATGDNSLNTTGCSGNNTLIYKGFINSSTSRSTVVEEAKGCSWTVEFEDGQFESFDVPQTYSGAKNCQYTNASHDPGNYTKDAYDIAVYTLLEQLDFDKDGRVFVNLAAEDLEIIVSLVSDVPYLWGPAILGVELWQ